MTALVDILTNLDDAAFKDLVDRDIRGTAIPEGYHDGLRSPEVCERWYQVLVLMKKSVEMTIAAKSTDDKATRVDLLNRGDDKKATAKRVEYLRWRSGAIRFLTGVEMTLMEATIVRREHNRGQLDLLMLAEREMLTRRVRKLSGAITQHRVAYENDDAHKPDSVDEKLWTVLEPDH